MTKGPPAMLARSLTLPAAFLTPEGRESLTLSLVEEAAPWTRGPMSSATFPAAATSWPGVNSLLPVSRSRLAQLQLKALHPHIPTDFVAWLACRLVADVQRQEMDLCWLSGLV